MRSGIGLRSVLLSAARVSEMRLEPLLCTSSSARTCTKSIDAASSPACSNRTDSRETST